MGIHILKSDIDNANIFAVYYASKLIPETDLSPPTGYQEAGAKLRKIKLKNNIQLLIIRHVDAPPTHHVTSTYELLNWDWEGLVSELPIWLPKESKSSRRYCPSRGRNKFSAIFMLYMKIKRRSYKFFGAYYSTLGKS